MLRAWLVLSLCLGTSYAYRDILAAVANNVVDDGNTCSEVRPENTKTSVSGCVAVTDAADLSGCGVGGCKGCADIKGMVSPPNGGNLRLKSCDGDFVRCPAGDGAVDFDQDLGYQDVTCDNGWQICVVQANAEDAVTLKYGTCSNRDDAEDIPLDNIGTVVLKGGSINPCVYHQSYPDGSPLLVGMNSGGDRARLSNFNACILPCKCKRSATSPDVNPVSQVCGASLTLADTYYDSGCNVNKPWGIAVTSDDGSKTLSPAPAPGSPLSFDTCGSWNILYSDCETGYTKSVTVTEGLTLESDFVLPTVDNRIKGVCPGSTVTLPVYSSPCKDTVAMTYEVYACDDARVCDRKVDSGSSTQGGQITLPDCGTFKVKISAGNCGPKTEQWSDAITVTDSEPELVECGVTPPQYVSVCNPLPQDTTITKAFNDGLCQLTMSMQASNKCTASITRTSVISLCGWADAAADFASAAVAGASCDVAP